MVGEMGMYGDSFMSNIIPRGEVKKYYTEITTALNKHDIPWIIGTLEGWFTPFICYPYFDQYTYQKLDGTVLWLDTDMADFFHDMFTRK
jgi:hypothetical protein